MNIDAIRSARSWWVTSAVRSAPWRTPNLGPRAPLVALGEPGVSPRSGTGVETEDERRARVVEDVVLRRAALITDVLTAASSGGRLLGSWGCNFSLGSGEAEALSRGFFDEYDLPPWDLWVGYEMPSGRQPYPGPVLIAWVPDELLEIAEAGVKACAADCVAWFHDHP